MNYTYLVVTGLCAFLGSFVGAFVGSRLMWRKQFVTREEAFLLARQIDIQHRAIDNLRTRI